jgi:hypothetical protein
MQLALLYNIANHFLSLGIFTLLFVGILQDVSNINGIYNFSYVARILKASVIFTASSSLQVADTAGENQS